MLVFPSELPLPDLPFEEEYEDNGIRIEMDGCTSLGRPCSTKRRLLSVSLNWQITQLTTPQYVVLQNFLDSVSGSGSNFQWTHPITGKLYENMRIRSQGKFAYGTTGEETWSGGIVIGEA